MLDIKLLREHPEIIKESQKKRGLSDDIVKEFLNLDKKWREIKKETDDLRAERNKISEQINQYKKQGKKIDDLIKKAREIPKKLEEKNSELVHLEEKRKEIHMRIPNIVDKSVPIGDVKKNKILKVIGKPVKKKIINHEELLTQLDLLDLERASKVSGSRFYYLKNDLVKLNQAIINFALDYLNKKGFTLIQPPFMLRRKALEGAINFAAFEEMIYKIEGEDLYLIGTAEHALNSYYMDEIIDGKKLPIRLAGISPCFRKEAGSHGKDTKGIFRIHQFEKIEQFIFCERKDSWKEFDLILNNSIELYKKLGIPFRVVLLSSQDMGQVATKTIDLEGWFPSQNAYRELGSCSNILDYQSRRTNVRFQEKGELEFVHTLNNTAIATERMIVCLVENYQQKDGSIKIPKVLIKYMNGQKVIKAKKEDKDKKSSKKVFIKDKNKKKKR